MEETTVDIDRKYTLLTFRPPQLLAIHWKYDHFCKEISMAMYWVQMLHCLWNIWKRRSTSILWRLRSRIPHVSSLPFCKNYANIYILNQYPTLDIHTLLFRYCLKPPIKEPPEGSWSCGLCVERFHKKPEQGSGSNAMPV